jgi:LrgB-like family
MNTLFPSPDPFALWVYLSGKPLLWLTVTLLAYVLADRISIRTNRHPLANPVPLAIGMICAILLASNTPYKQYFEGAQFVHFLIGPATVALAVPIWAHPFGAACGVCGGKRQCRPHRQSLWSA